MTEGQGHTLTALKPPGITARVWLACLRPSFTNVSTCEIQSHVFIIVYLTYASAAVDWTNSLLKHPLSFFSSSASIRKTFRRVELASAFFRATHRNSKKLSISLHLSVLTDPAPHLSLLILFSLLFISRPHSSPFVLTPLISLFFLSVLWSSTPHHLWSFGFNMTESCGSPDLFQPGGMQGESRNRETEERWKTALPLLWVHSFPKGSSILGCKLLSGLCRHTHEHVIPCCSPATKK